MSPPRRLHRHHPASPVAPGAPASLAQLAAAVLACPSPGWPPPSRPCPVLRRGWSTRCSEGRAGPRGLLLAPRGRCRRGPSRSAPPSGGGRGQDGGRSPPRPYPLLSPCVPIPSWTSQCSWAGEGRPRCVGQQRRWGGGWWGGGSGGHPPPRALTERALHVRPRTRVLGRLHLTHRAPAFASPGVTAEAGRPSSAPEP